MRSVRCDVCGTKALMAASQCPKCGHPFSVRNGFGELLPLAHCSTCDSDYPASIGSCKWCGTKPERAPMAPYIWKGVGIAAFAGMAWGAWLVHDDKPKPTPDSRLASLLKPDSTTPAADSSVAPRSLASIGVANDTMVRDTPTSVVSADTVAEPSLTPVASSDSIVSVQSAGAVAEPEPVALVDSSAVRAVPREPVREIVREPVRGIVREPVREPARATPRQPARDIVRAPSRGAARPSAAAAAPSRVAARPPAAAAAPSRVAARPPAKATPRLASAPKATTSRTRKVGRWTSSIARNWVIVRADPNRRSRIIASIGPNTRVQLGEARGEWRRIKTKGLSGWVEHRSLFAVVPPPSRVGRLAAR